VPCCTAPAMAASAESCLHCGKQGAGFKRCSRCKQAWYCGAACRNAGWKRHKKACAPPVSLRDVAANLKAASAAEDWRGLLKWEGRMEELIAGEPDDYCERVLRAFAKAHNSGLHATGSKDHARSFVGLQERRIPLLGKLQRFWDQADAMSFLASALTFLGSHHDACISYQRARDIGAAHGFFSIESTACLGLGKAAVGEGRHEEGVELLRNSLAAAELNELDDPAFELTSLAALVKTFFEAHAIDDAEPLVLRYREAAKARSATQGGVCYVALDSVLYSARLHEVLTPLWVAIFSLRVFTRSCAPRVRNPFTLLGSVFWQGRPASG